MNFRDLKYVLAVAEERNFTKAAKKVFTTQPTLSMQIDKLEDELGVKIFERGKKNFIITEAGKEIIKKVEVILLEEENLRKIAKEYTNPLSGKLKIGAFPTLAPYLFPEVIFKIHKKFPDLNLFLVEEKTEILISKLKKGEIDLAFLASPINESDFNKIIIFEEEFLLAAPKNHKLAKSKKIKIKDLRNYEMMLLEEGHCMRNQALEFCSIIGSLEKQDFRASSLETLIEMIKTGNGITLIPKIAAKKDRRISFIKIENPPIREISLYYRKNSVNKDLFEKLARIVIEKIGK